MKEPKDCIHHPVCKFADDHACPLECGYFVQEE